MNKLSSLLLVLLIIFVACNQKHNTDASKAYEEINRLYKGFAEAYDNLNSDKVANLYAKDSFYLVPNPQRDILEGRSSIRKSFADFIDGAAGRNRSLDISFRIIKRKISDSLAFDVGYYRTRSKPDTAAAFPQGGGVGKFVTVIGLMPDGSWKFLLDGYNPAPYKAFAGADSNGFNPAE